MNADTLLPEGCDCHKRSGRGVYCFRRVSGQPLSFVGGSNDKGDCLHMPGLYRASSIRSYGWSDYNVRQTQSTLLFLVLALQIVYEVFL